jgi:hypothetical protein
MIRLLDYRVVVLPRLPSPAADEHEEPTPDLPCGGADR